jgi:Domain of unknown function (DUF4291)
MIVLERYEAQIVHWPRSGKQILAQFDDESIVVYQAYKPQIGLFAARNGKFGDGFSFSRMSWIKPNFLWMMFRSGWGTKTDQEVTLAIRMKRDGFEMILSQAIASTFGASGFGTKEDWEKAVTKSNVRLQWDPDHDPSGKPVARRAIQLGLRNEILRRWNDEWIVSIEDITPIVKMAKSDLMIPKERAYPLSSALQSRLQMA